MRNHDVAFRRTGRYFPAFLRCHGKPVQRHRAALVALLVAPVEGLVRPGGRDAFQCQVTPDRHGSSFVCTAGGGRRVLHGQGGQGDPTHRTSRSRFRRVSEGGYFKLLSLPVTATQALVVFCLSKMINSVRALAAKPTGRWPEHSI